MPRSIPYQPLVLRILHGVAGLLAIAALLTGYLVYNTYDGRFGALPLPQLPDIQGIHGTFGLFFLLIFPALAIYSFHWGQKRLLQKDFAQRFTQQVGKPVWWVNLHRITNTLMLLAAAFAVVSGRMMQEAWLPAGEVDQIGYRLHLLSWLVMLACLLMHVLMSVKVGGIPLVQSMISVRYRPEDSPTLWAQNIRNWLDRGKNRE
jgi:hypothetical protein